jgi:gluconolactonase
MHFLPGLYPCSFLALATVLATGGSSLAQNPSFPPAQATIGKIERLAPEFDALVPTTSQIEVLASGFDWVEGPVWKADASLPGGGVLLFSEIPSNSVMQCQPEAPVGQKGASVFLQPSGYTGVGKYSAEPGSNGLAFDSKGQLVSCEHGDRRLSVLTTGGGKRTLADNIDGKRFNSPNDLTISKSGDVYFTDPFYGLPKQAEDTSRETPWCGVYRWNHTTGKVTLESKALARPNGIAFSPKEDLLYVAQSDPTSALWMAFPVKQDGSLGEGKVFKDVTEMAATKQYKGLPDGMKVDSQGNLWATGPGGVHVMSPTGKLLGRIDPGENTSNCAFGPGYLYLTVDMHICRVKLAK